jgi:hypothetical protein
MNIFRTHSQQLSELFEINIFYLSIGKAGMNCGNCAKIAFRAKAASANTSRTEEESPCSVEQSPYLSTSYREKTRSILGV